MLIFTYPIAWEVLHSSVYIFINIITKLQLHCFLQGKYCWWEMCAFISFKVLYLSTTFPKCLNYRTKILYECLRGYKKSTHKVLVTHKSATGKHWCIQYTQVLNQEAEGITSLQETIWNIYYTLLSIHFYCVSSYNMGLLSLVYPVVLFYHCIFHRVKLTPSAELYKLLLLSMFTYAKRFNSIPSSWTKSLL